MQEDLTDFGTFQEGALDSLRDFEALFQGAKFYKGLEMIFTNTQAGALALRIGGEDVSPLISLPILQVYAYLKRLLRSPNSCPGIVLAIATCWAHHRQL